MCGLVSLHCRDLQGFLQHVVRWSYSLCLGSVQLSLSLRCLWQEMDIRSVIARLQQQNASLLNTEQLLVSTGCTLFF